MATQMLALETLLSDIADFAKNEMETGDLSGRRFGALVKLAWCGQSGEPCFSLCESIIEALDILRDSQDNSTIDAFYVAVNAMVLELYPEQSKDSMTIEAIRDMSHALAKVA